MGRRVEEGGIDRKKRHAAAKAAGAEAAGERRNEKVLKRVARSTFSSQNAQKPRCLDHFWKSRCWRQLVR